MGAPINDPWGSSVSSNPFTDGNQGQNQGQFPQQNQGQNQGPNQGPNQGQNQGQFPQQNQGPNQGPNQGQFPQQGQNQDVAMNNVESGNVPTPSAMPSEISAASLSEFNMDSSGGKAADYTRDANGKIVRFNSVAKDKLVVAKNITYDPVAIPAGPQVPANIPGYVFDALIVDPINPDSWFLWRGSVTNKAVVRQLAETVNAGYPMRIGKYTTYVSKKNGRPYFAFSKISEEDLEKAANACKASGFLN